MAYTMMVKNAGENDEGKESEEIDEENGKEISSRDCDGVDEKRVEVTGDSQSFRTIDLGIDDQTMLDDGIVPQFRVEEESVHVEVGGRGLDREEDGKEDVKDDMEDNVNKEDGEDDAGIKDHEETEVVETRNVESDGSVLERQDPSVVIKDVLGELEEKGNEEGDGDGDENQDDGRDEKSELVCLSDSSPGRKKHKYVPSELEEALARLLSTLRMSDPHELLADADEKVLNVFRDTLDAHPEIVHVTKSGLPLDK